MALSQFYGLIIGSLEGLANRRRVAEQRCLLHTAVVVHGQTVLGLDASLPFAFGLTHRQRRDSRGDVLLSAGPSGLGHGAKRAVLPRPAAVVVAQRSHGRLLVLAHGLPLVLTDRLDDRRDKILLEPTHQSVVGLFLSDTHALEDLDRLPHPVLVAAVDSVSAVPGSPMVLVIVRFGLEALFLLDEVDHVSIGDDGVGHLLSVRLSEAIEPSLEPVEVGVNGVKRLLSDLTHLLTGTTRCYLDTGESSLQLRKLEIVRVFSTTQDGVHLVLNGVHKTAKTAVTVQDRAGPGHHPVKLSVFRLSLLYPILDVSKLADLVLGTRHGRGSGRLLLATQARLIDRGHSQRTLLLKLLDFRVTLDHVGVQCRHGVGLSLCRSLNRGLLVAPCANVCGSGLLSVVRELSLALVQIIDSRGQCLVIFEPLHLAITESTSRARLSRQPLPLPLNRLLVGQGRLLAGHRERRTLVTRATG